MKITHPEDSYLNLLKEVLEKGDRKIDQGTGDASYSLFGRQIRFDLSTGQFPLLTTKRVYWKGVLHELYWFLSGQSNISYLVNNDVHIWDDYPYKIYCEKNKARGSVMTKDMFIERIKTNAPFARKWGELPRIYGQMWRRWPTRTKRTIDQLQWVIDEIKADPNAHNLIVNSWNPEYLYTMAQKRDASRFPICHNMYQVNILGGKLCLQLYQRSADLFLGVPFNIASYALLTHILAHITGYPVGEFIHTLGDLHIYESHLNQVREQINRKPQRFPSLSFSTPFNSLKAFKPEYVGLHDYMPLPAIKAPLSVSGGFIDRKKA